MNVTACLGRCGPYGGHDVFPKAMPGFQQQKRLALQVVCIDLIAIGQRMIAPYCQIEDVPTKLCYLKFIEVVGMGDQCYIERT
ncbi:Uncharacterised protein [Brucella anthropi]|nr:hypothetical protein DR92_2658 [Brucella anthropi]SUB43570.1 Uncharacterised protein [Brucella anthropi]